MGRTVEMKCGEILENSLLKTDYYRIKFYAPEIAAKALPGQFVHVRISEDSIHILRRPFSIHDTAPDGTVTLVYKVVGAGTRELAAKKPGDVCDLLGPLGTNYTPAPEGSIPVIVAGGYGSAAMYMLTRTMPNPAVVLIGARSEADVILDDVYREAGCQVKIATNDGSMGHKGFVTELIDEVIAENPGKQLVFYGCGPQPMLIALGKIMKVKGLPGELSFDHLMGCGVGACFGCVVKVAADTPEGWAYARACKDGPVFDIDKCYLGD